jgi:hypothetical protein
VAFVIVDAVYMIPAYMAASELASIAASACIEHREEGARQGGPHILSTEEYRTRQVAQLKASQQQIWCMYCEPRRQK